MTRRTVKKLEREPLKPGEHFIYLTLFTIEGHRTWRPHLSQYSEAFDRYIKAQPKHPKVTARRVVKIDRVTGEIKLV